MEFFHCVWSKFDCFYNSVIYRSVKVYGTGPWHLLGNIPNFRPKFCRSASIALERIIVSVSLRDVSFSPLSLSLSHSLSLYLFLTLSLSLFLTHSDVCVTTSYTNTSSLKIGAREFPQK